MQNFQIYYKNLICVFYMRKSKFGMRKVKFSFQKYELGLRKENLVEQGIIISNTRNAYIIIS